jgi:AAA15 family ATPase/GTPase
MKHEDLAQITDLRNKFFIIDEVDHFVFETEFSFMSQKFLKSAKFVGLSATLTSDKNETEKLYL